jgi:hypothetical protein
VYQQLVRQITPGLKTPRLPGGEHWADTPHAQKAKKKGLESLEKLL